MKVSVLKRRLILERISTCKLLVGSNAETSDAYSEPNSELVEDFKKHYKLPEDMRFPPG